MSREKQIEEMAEHLIEIQQNFNEYCAKPCRECELGGVVNCESHYKAEQLYNAGYRKQKWISVYERLPEECTHVIVHDEDGTVGEAFHSSGDCFEWVANEKMAFPTHWMPLPEPPKGE